ncbi:MAG TPA: CPBP family intramembrane glutamic endopeptidase [Chitinophagaceae bacterium]|jgi:membrane protease YdiL (CAAX protease family)
MDNFPHWVDHIIAFLVCIALPLYAARQRTKGTTHIHFSSDQKKQIYISGSFSLFVMGAIVVSIWLIFQRPLSELGLTQPGNFRSWWWLAIIFVLVYLLDVFVSLSSKKEIDKTIEDFKRRTPFLPTKNSELPEYLLMCFSAGVFEEIVYRGYLITYCWYLFEGYTYQQMIAVVLPALAFSVAHFYQGAKAVLKIFFFALFFGYLFIYSGSLLIVMILHFLVDAAGGLLTIKYMKEHVQQPDDENNFLQ